MSNSFAHYNIVESIGAGGMGEVFRARDTQLDRDVALKILPQAFALEPERLARFEREAKLLASLNHPNIASIYAIVRDSGRTALALELVEGENLAERVGRGRLPLDDSLDIASQIATALEAAHEQGIIHRDLKPANVRITPDGVVKVLDFGLAKALDTDPDSSIDPSISQSPTMMGTQAGMILGTAAYMSPEQARGKKLDRRTDIFSYGALLYELLSGERAFTGETVSDTLASVLKEKPDLGKLPDRTPQAIRLLLERCLEKDPRTRLRDIGEARLILDEVRGGDSTASRILGSGSTLLDTGDTPKPPRVRPREIAAWVVSIVMVAVAGAVILHGYNSGTSAPTISSKLSVPIPGDTDLRDSRGGLVISPDGIRIAYINDRKLYVRQLDSWEPIEVQQTEGCISPFWSPDSRWLGYTQGNDMWKVRADGTQRTLICSSTTEFSNVSGGAWLADERVVYRGEKNLMVVSASGGDPTVFVHADSLGAVDFHQPSALTGGDGLVVGIHTEKGVQTIGRVTLDGVTTRLITIPGGDLSWPCYSPSGHILVRNNADLWAVAFSLETNKTTGDPFSVARGASIPSVSDAGTLVYIAGAGSVERQLVLVDRTGAIKQRLGRPMDMWASYALSPDGSRAVTMKSNSTDLWLHDNRNAVTRATFTDIEHDMPSFSANGDVLYFATGTEAEYRIGRKSADGLEPEEILVAAGELGPHYYAACPVVTTDGSVLFYTAIGSDKKQDIAWLDLASGSTPRPFLSGAAREYAAMPSPNGHEYIAYVSDESGAAQVYLTTWPAADRKLSVSIDGGNWPHWKEDGSEIYFADGNDIFAVEVSYQPLRLGAPRKLFSRPEFDERQAFGWPATFDVTPDGQLFLVTDLVVDHTLSPYIAIIENWAAELDQ